MVVHTVNLADGTLLDMVQVFNFSEHEMLLAPKSILDKSVFHVLD